MAAARYQLHMPVGSVIGAGGFGQVTTAYMPSTANLQIGVQTVVAKKSAYFGRSIIPDRPGRRRTPDVQYQPPDKKQCVDTRALQSRVDALKWEASILVGSVGHHPNVVSLLANGTQNARYRGDCPPYILLPLALGTLRQLLAYDSEHLSPRARLGLAVDICNGLAHVHHCGYVHCDVKSSNVLVEYSVPLQRYVALVSDFGIARRVPDELSVGMVSPTFMSGQFASMYPEYRPLSAALDRHNADKGLPGYYPLPKILKAVVSFGPCVDVFALGTVLSELFLNHQFRDKVTADQYHIVSDLISRCKDTEPRKRPDAAFVCRSLLAVNR